MSDRHSRHTDAAHEALSALVDGQAHPDELSQILREWKTDAAMRAAWRDYQLVGDVMRSADLAQGADSDRFLQKLRANLVDEPVVLAPAAARTVMPARNKPMAPVAALRRRRWLGPTAVAAGFVMVVGAMVSALAPDASVPADVLASSGPRIELAAQETDPALGVAAVVPVASALVATNTLAPASGGVPSVSVTGDSFSRPARPSAMLMRDPRLDQALLMRGHPSQQEAAFASHHPLSQAVVYELP